MKQDLHQNEDAVTEIQSSFVALLVKPSDKLPLLKQLGVRAFPTTAIISPDGRLLARMTGYVPPENLRKQLKASIEKARVATRAEDHDPK